MARYLVTGAAGFIGSRVAELLLEQGHTVVGVDDMNDAYDVRLKHWRLSRLVNHPGFDLHQVDICDEQGIAPVFYSPASDEPPFAAVINLAARAGVRASVLNPEIYYRTNVVGTLHLLELCRQTGVNKFVLASSSSLYGKSPDVPYREDSNTDQPLSPYAASKKAAEALCYTYHYLHGLDITAFRYFTVYGPAGRPDMSPLRFVQWISEGRPVLVYGDGQQSRDFTFVDDIARGTVAGLKPVGYEVINLGSDRPIVLSEMIATIERLTNQTAVIDRRPQHAADVPTTWADIGKARQLLGWEPQISFQQGMGRLVDWYARNREWAREINTRDG